MKKKKFSWIIFPAIILGMILGAFAGQESSLFGITFYSFFDLIGKLFINALMLIVVPLVFSSIIVGVSRIERNESFGKLGAKTFFFFFLSNFLALCVAFLLTSFFQQAIAHSSQMIRTVNLPPQTSSITPDIATAAAPHFDFSRLLLQFIPTNIFFALSHGQMLGIIFFSLLFGYTLAKLDTEFSAPLKDLFRGTFQAMIFMTHLLMKFLPLGVFCLVAKQFALTGFSSLRPLAVYFLITFSGFLLFLFIVLPLLLKIFGKTKNPYILFKAMYPALVAAFSTCSSSACLPITMDCIEKKAKVSNRISSIVLPLGNSLNLSGSSLYIYITVIFIMHMYGIPITISSQILILFMTLILALGEAGVPSAALVIIIAILKTLNLPIEAVGFFLAIDRFLDMCRTTVNVFANTCSTVLVARSEGEKTILANKNS